MAQQDSAQSTCHICEGEGMVLAGVAINSPAFRPGIVRCPACGGAGELDPSWPEPTEDLYREGS